MRGTKWVVLALASAGLCSCATTGHMIPTSEAISVAGQDVDAEKVATVNQWGQTHGATILWINYPVRAHPRVAGSSGGG